MVRIYLLGGKHVAWKTVIPTEMNSVYTSTGLGIAKVVGYEVGKLYSDDKYGFSACRTPGQHGHVVRSCLKRKTNQHVFAPVCFLAEIGNVLSHNNMVTRLKVDSFKLLEESSELPKKWTTLDKILTP